MTDPIHASLTNLYDCLSFHPAVQAAKALKPYVRLLIAVDAANYPIGKQLRSRCPSHFACELLELAEGEEATSKVRTAIEECDIFVFLYDSSTLSPPLPAGPAFLAPLRQTMSEQWRKSVLFKDYGEHIYAAFSEPIEAIIARNAGLIELASVASHVQYQDGCGGSLRCALPRDGSWTSIEGRGNEDVVPGEIAMHPVALEGTVTFSGTFLGTVPFARKYGVCETLVTLDISASQVRGFRTKNPEFQRDFTQYLEHNDGNRIVEEFGIGTNMGVRQLLGRNAGFEERHPGLHLGLGGGRHGSHHLDLIFSSGTLSFDDAVFFRNGTFDLKRQQ
jgi:hypothetical protein